MNRRRLLETGAGGVVLLALGGCAPAGGATGTFDDPGYSYRALTPGDRNTIAAVAAVVLAGSLPAESAARAAASIEVVRGVDVAISGLPPSVQEEIGQLFGLLRFPPTRALAAGIWRPWESAGTDSVSNFLTGWRFSSVALFRSGYQALHQLVMASWYGNGASWAGIAYPGPPRV
ncbi:MAG: hypothetical protein JO241_10785 [Candidatus Eremiobacteraeota bacterium]|nr:hypothetical protein [Candidatus Eremiobacteraeota bacterium]